MKEKLSAILVKVVRELFKIILKLLAGGLGAIIFAESLKAGQYVTCGAVIVFFFELFWICSKEYTKPKQ